MTSNQEIERSYLLDGVPDLPAEGDSVRIEQGYLPEAAGLGDQDITEGRIRRTRGPGDRVKCTHTIKRGQGLVRTEHEETIDADHFEAAWPRTEGRRLTKTRHRVREGEFTWEIDVFDEIDLVLAEVELPTAATVVPIPAWLEPRIVREVTEDPAYRNFEIAARAARARADGGG
jgi:CYTH domain-containing protein